MTPYALTGLILCFVVLIGYLNHHYVQLQTTIAMTVSALILSLLLLTLKGLGFEHFANLTGELMQEINFRELLLKGMLGFLLFAGSLSIDIAALKNQKWEIGILATLSTLASTVIIGTLSYFLLIELGLPIPYLYCLLFGALISPTDPIAVLATFKHIGAPKKLTACISGESLFNDGIGIVVFLTLYQFAFNHIEITATKVSLLFFQQAIGGIGYGIILGLITQFFIKRTHDAHLLIFLTLAIVMGGYTFALTLDISGPLAMVVAGILIGNTVRQKEFKKNTLLLEFWEVIDQLLNAILFLLIGFEVTTLNITEPYVLAGLLLLPIILLVRLITVAVPMKLIQLKRLHEPFMITLLTWGGLRGGLAVALALSLPDNLYRNIILVLTYIIVAFSIIVQGITIKPLAKFVLRKSKS